MTRGIGNVCGVALGCLMAIGCGGSYDPNRRPTKPVEVTVTYKGVPVEGATVTFVSTSEGNAIPAVGRTNAQGVAKMKTYEEGDGAVLGNHRVMVLKNEIANDRPAADQDSPDYVPPSMRGSPVPVLKDLIPKKYASPVTSGLTAHVTEDGPNEIQFALND